MDEERMIWSEETGSKANDADGAPAGRTETPAAVSSVDENKPQDTDAAEGSEEQSEGLAGLVQSVAEPVHDHIVAPVAGALSTVVGAANTAWTGQNAAVRRLRRQAREPLANLYEMYPEARQASPRELGLHFVPLEEIRGTAVAGSAQRGGDFLPLKQLRGENWKARWDRLTAANERLQSLPPVDLVKYDGAYWVVDGHNRVAVALYAGGTGLDAMVTELVPLDGQASERPSALLEYLGEAGELRAAAQGHSLGMHNVEPQPPEEIDALEALDDETPDPDSIPDEPDGHADTAAPEAAD
jgi:hypothetical protein